MSGGTPPDQGRITRIFVSRWDPSRLGSSETPPAIARRQARSWSWGLPFDWEDCLTMSLRLHEIAEANHRILNPFTDEKLMLHLGWGVFVGGLR